MIADCYPWCSGLRRIDSVNVRDLLNEEFARLGQLRLSKAATKVMTAVELQ